MFFGTTTEFIVNYTPDQAVRFDLEGRPVEAFTRAHHPGEGHAVSERPPILTESSANVSFTISEERLTGRSEKLGR